MNPVEVPLHPPAAEPPACSSPHALLLHHADRVLPLQGVSNFRDLGGYPGLDGRAVRWRRLFRSDHLGALTDADRFALAALGLSRVFDFRGLSESAAMPNVLPGVPMHALAIEPTVVQRMQDVVAAGRSLDGPTAEKLMKDLYRHLIDGQAHRFAALFQQLLADDRPSVFHCTAGKDRTGVAAALILLALGVPRDLVMADFMLTNRLFKPPLPASRHAGHPLSQTPPEALAVLWQVQEDFLHTALLAIDDDHGGVERYLSQRLGVGPAERESLAQRYLQAS